MSSLQTNVPFNHQISQMEEKYKNRNSQLHSVLQEKSILLTQTKAKDAEIHKLTGTINHLTSHVGFHVLDGR